MVSQIEVQCSFQKMVGVHDLQFHPRNPNKHTDEQIDLIWKLLQGHGWRGPIVVSNQSGYITRGEGRLRAAIKYEEKQLPVDYQDYDDDDQEMADVVADNAIQELSFFDRGLLRDVLGDIDSFPVDMEFTGFKPVDVESLFTAVPPPGSGQGEGSSGTEGDGGDQGASGESRDKPPPKKPPAGSEPGAIVDVSFEFGVYKGKIQTCMFEDFEKKHDFARKGQEFASLDQTLRHLIGLDA